MTLKITAFISLALVMAAATIPATGQTPGRDTPLAADDHQILKLVGGVFGDAMEGIGAVHRYLLLDEEADKNRFFAQIKQADAQLLQLRQLLQLTRPNDRDLLQSLEPVVTAKNSMDTGATTMLATMGTTKK